MNRTPNERPPERFPEALLDDARYPSASLWLAHDAGCEPVAAGAADEKGDVGLGRADCGQGAHIAAEFHFALRAERHERCIDQDRIAASRAAVGVAHERAAHLRVGAPRADTVAPCEHKPFDFEPQIAIRQVHFCAPAGDYPRLAGACDRAGAGADDVSRLDHADERIPAHLARGNSDDRRAEDRRQDGAENRYDFYLVHGTPLCWTWHSVFRSNPKGALGVSTADGGAPRGAPPFQQVVSAAVKAALPAGQCTGSGMPGMFS